MNNTVNQNMKRLAWQCRRGMLELDIMLERYLYYAYEHASSDEQKQFQELLTHNDQDLFVWLTGRASPLDRSLLSIVHKIRKTSNASLV